MRGLSEFLGNAGIGVLLGLLAPVLFVIGRPHALVLWSVAQVDFRIKLVLVIAGALMAITIVKAIASVARTITKIDKSLGALGYLVAVIPSVVAGYYYALTLPDPAPVMIDLLEMANLAYENGTHRLIDDPSQPEQATVGGFQSGQSSRLPQVGSETSE